MRERASQIGMDRTAIAAAVAGLLVAPVAAFLVTNNAQFVGAALAFIVLEAILLARPVWGTYMVIAGMLFNEIGVSAGFAILGVGDFALFALLPAWGVRILFGAQKLRLPKHGWALALYVVLAALSLFYGVRPSSAYGPGMRLAVYVVGLVAMVDILRDEKALRGAVWVIAVCGIVHAVISMTNMGAQARLSGLVEQPNELGVRLGMGAVACAGLVSGYAPRAVKAVAGVSFVVVLVAILLTVSRGTYISTTLAFAWWIRRHKRVLVFVLLGVGALTVTYNQLAQFRVGFIQQRLELKDSSVRGRWQVMKNAVVAVQERPLLGVGYAQFSQMDRVVEIGRERARGAHNFYLGSAASVGLPATALLLFFLFSAARAVVRRRREAARVEAAELVWLLGVVEALFVYDAVSMLFRGGRPIMLFTMAGLYVAASMYAAEDAEAPADEAPA